METNSKLFIQEFCDNIEYYLIKEWKNIRHQVYNKRSLYWQEFVNKFGSDTAEQTSHKVGYLNPIFMYMYDAGITLPWVHLVRTLLQRRVYRDWIISEWVIFPYFWYCTAFDLDRTSELIQTKERIDCCYSDLISMLYVWGCLPRLVNLYALQIEDELHKRIASYDVPTEKPKKVTKRKKSAW